MPNLQNAKKALRVSGRRRVMNEKRRRTMKEAVKSIKVSLRNGEKKVGDQLAKAYQAIDKAAKRGVIKKGAAARKKSRLAATLKKAA